MIVSGSHPRNCRQKQIFCYLFHAGITLCPHETFRRKRIIIMARREITQYFDDLDKTPLTEEQLRVIRFSLEGVNYTLDLSEENAEKFQALLQPYVEVASKAPRERGAKANPADIRAWAAKHGHQVAHRGKIPTKVIEAYHAANPAR